jgi:hypothetical protein
LVINRLPREILVIIFNYATPVIQDAVSVAAAGANPQLFGSIPVASNIGLSRQGRWSALKFYY